MTVAANRRGISLMPSKPKRSIASLADAFTQNFLQKVRKKAHRLLTNIPQDKQERETGLEQ